MGIYIFEPSGGAGSQNLQQVLNNGSALTQNNDITTEDILSFTTSASNEGFYQFGDITKTNQGYFVFDVNSGNDGTIFQGMNNGVTDGIYIDNKSSSWKFGDIIGGNCIKYEPSLDLHFNIDCFLLKLTSQNITFATDGLRYIELNSGSLISTDNGNTSNDHLKIQINGNDYLIALRTPTP